MAVLNALTSTRPRPSLKSSYQSKPPVCDIQLSQEAFWNIWNVSAPDIWFHSQNLKDLRCRIISRDLKIVKCTFCYSERQAYTKNYRLFWGDILYRCHCQSYQPKKLNISNYYDYLQFFTHSIFRQKIFRSFHHHAGHFQALNHKL